MGRVWMRRVVGICASARAGFCESGFTAKTVWQGDHRGGTAPTRLPYTALFSIASSSTFGRCAPDSATLCLKMRKQVVFSSR